ncbi:MAG: hypothetical protein ACR2F8_03120 [Caulobacteraceae bacterium]
MKDLKLSLVVQAIDKATSPLRKIGGVIGGLQGRVTRFNNVFKKIGVGEVLGGAALIGGATLAAKSILDLTNKTADLGEGFLHAAQKAGTTVEVIQRLGFAAKQLGVDPDDLSRGIFMMQRQMVDAMTGKKEPRRAFGALHISMPEVKALSRDPEKAILRVAEAFTKIRNPAVRAKLAMDLFSRAGIRMLPMLLAGGDELKRLEAQIIEAHGVLTQKDAESAERYIQAKNRMGIAVRGLEMQVGSRLIPTLTNVIDKVTAWIEHMSPGALQKFTDAVNNLVQKLPDLMPKLERVLTLASNFADKILDLASNTNFMKGVLIALAAFIGAQFLVVMVEAGAAIVTLGGFLAGLVAPALAASVALFGIEIPILAIVVAVGLIAGAVYLVITHWKQIAAFFKGLWDKVGQIFGGALKWIEANTPIGWLYDRWNGIVPFFAGLWGKIEDILSGAWKRIAAATPDWLKTILKVGAMAGFAANPAMAMAAATSFMPHGARPAAPVAGPARAIHRPAAGAAGAAGKVDVNIRVDQDGRARVKSARSSNPDIFARVMSGVFPG